MSDEVRFTNGRIWTDWGILRLQVIGPKGGCTLMDLKMTPEQLREVAEFLLKLADEKEEVTR